MFSLKGRLKLIFVFFLENFHLIHHPIPFQGVDVRIVSNFRGSPHPIQTLWNISCVLYFRCWLLEEYSLSLSFFFFLNSTRSHIMKALQFTGENLVRGCSYLRFSWRNVCFFPLPNTIKCSFGKLYFTIVIIIIKMKFRSITILLAAALAVFKSSGRKAFIQFAIRQIFLSCLPAV